MGRMFCQRKFFPSKKRGDCVGKNKKGKGTKFLVVVDGEGVPMGGCIASATPHEVKLIEKAIETVTVPRRRGIDLITPHRRNRNKKPLQDGRKLRRYRRRYKVERTIAWLGNYRRLLIRYENSVIVFTAFFHIACMMIVLNKLLA